jgi:hypothetical protein
MSSYAHSSLSRREPVTAQADPDLEILMGLGTSKLRIKSPQPSGHFLVGDGERGAELWFVMPLRAVWSAFGASPPVNHPVIVSDAAGPYRGRRASNGARPGSDAGAGDVLGPYPWPGSPARSVASARTPSLPTPTDSTAPGDQRTFFSSATRVSRSHQRREGIGVIRLR